MAEMSPWPLIRASDGLAVFQIVEPDLAVVEENGERLSVGGGDHASRFLFPFGFEQCLFHERSTAPGRLIRKGSHAAVGGRHDQPRTGKGQHGSLVGRQVGLAADRVLIRAGGDQFEQLAAGKDGQVCRRCD